MNSLIPVQRVDRRGRVVTRWVRSDTEKQRIASIPSPKTTIGRPDRTELVSHVREAMVRGNHGFKGLRPVASIYTSMERLSDSTVAAYLTAIADSPKSGFDELLIGVLNADTPGNEADYLLEIAKLYTTGSTFNGDVGRRYCDVAKQAYLGLRCYPEIDYSAPEDITDRNDPETVKVMGLLRLTMRLFTDDHLGIGITGEMTDYGVGMKVDSDELAELVLERPYDAERIAAAVIGRETTDIGTICEMLSSEAVNLQDGVL